jgi:hypothetical protein
MLLLVQIQWGLLLKDEIKQVSYHLHPYHKPLLYITTNKEIVPKLEVLLEPDPILWHLLLQHLEQTLQT